MLLAASAGEQSRTKELQDKMKEHLVDRAVEIDQGWYFDQI